MEYFDSTPHFRVYPWLSKHTALISSAITATILVHICFEIFKNTFLPLTTLPAYFLIIVATALNFTATCLLSFRKTKNLHLLHVFGDSVFPVSLYLFIISLNSTLFLNIISTAVFIVASILIATYYIRLSKEKPNTKKRHPRLMLMDIKTALSFSMLIPLLYLLR